MFRILKQVLRHYTSTKFTYCWYAQLLVIRLLHHFGLEDNKDNGVQTPYKEKVEHKCERKYPKQLIEYDVHVCEEIIEKSPEILYL